MEQQVYYPIGRADFKDIRKEGFLYVDKTEYIYKMMEEKGKFYFLARPRRFGKSLFLNTLHEFFKGNHEIFKGLAIDKLQPQEWESYPVLHFNMSGAAFLEANSLVSRIENQLDRLEEDFGMSSDKTIGDRFENLIIGVHKKLNKQVVILIDEYDSPLSSAIGKPELQEIYREQLHGFYSVLKNTEPYIRFCMLTGVTRYGKVAVFSGLNNLKDITFDDNYAGVCGITEKELHEYYEVGTQALAEKEGITHEEAFGLLKFHYDGYHFSKCMLDVYNPFSINHAMQQLEIKDYWCRSGVPTLLSKSLLENDFDVEKLRGNKVTESDLIDLSLYDMKPVPLFFQTGYLTIQDYEPRRQRFTLGYPNREVEAGILNNILNFYMPGNEDKRNIIYNMEDALEDGNPETFVKEMSSFLTGIPTQLHKYVDKYENYYHTIFYCIARLIGLDVYAEYSTSQGFIDILIKTTKYIYIVELKVNGTAEDAIKQIETKNYAAPFATDSRKLFKIGIGFSKKTHSVKSLIVE